MRPWIGSADHCHTAKRGCARLNSEFHDPVTSEMPHLLVRVGHWIQQREPAALVGGCRSSNGEVLFGSGQTGIRSGVANDAVGIEVHLPVVGVAAVRANRKNWAGQSEGQDLHVGRRRGQHIGDLSQVRPQQRDDLVYVGGMVELRLQVDTAIRIGAEVLDDLGKDLAVTDDVAYVVEGVDRSDKQSDLFDRTHYAAGNDKVAHFKRLEDNEEDAGGKIGQQSAPSEADGDASGGDQGCKTGGLDSEETQNRDDENDIQQCVDGVLDVADDRRVNVLPGHAAADHSVDKADQPATDDPECKGRDHRDGK